MTVLLILVFLASGLLQIGTFKPVFASYANSYPWDSAPCAASGANLGHTSGTGYWCSGYNWGENPCPTGDGYCTSSWLMNNYYLLDQWGEGFRNCVSYTAWQLNQRFNVNPSSWGNGTDWNNSAIAAGYSDDSSPRVGDIAQWDGTTGNSYGHVAYVYATSSGIASYAEYNYLTDGTYQDSYTSASGSQGTPTHWIHIGTPSGSHGTSTIGQFNPANANFYLSNSNSTGSLDDQFQFGGGGWKPVVGDWNGDGIETIGAVDPGTQTFYLRNSNNAGSADAGTPQFGAGGWIPIAGNWDGL